MTTKTVYLFDAISGEYSGTYEAQESPVQPGSFIVPTSSTDIPPPSLQIGEKAVFSNSAWNVIPAPLPPLPSPAQPNASLFAQDIKTNIGGILVANSLMVAYPAFFPAIQSQSWADVQTLIIDAQAKGVITTTQYGVIKNSAATYSIPITLP